jgi:predicted outer membrane repeat protein
MKTALVGALVLVSSTLAAEAATLHVPADHPTIQAGIDAALGGDTVLVADGIYTGPGNREIDFHGQGITVRSASGDPELCIIDCADAEPHTGVYFHSGEDSTSVLDGFTIQNGVATHATEWPGGYAGGGIFCDLARPLLQRLILRANSAPYSGLGAGLAVDGYTFSAGPIVRDCRIVENASGGVFVYGGARFERCEIARNTGIGLDLHWGNVRFLDCVISGNDIHLFGMGDGIEIRNSTLAAALDGHHGARISFFDCDLSGHRLYSFENFLEFHNCTIRDCPDGALVVEYGFGLTIENCLFAGNSAAGGGAIQLGVLSDALITGTRFENNFATGSGGALQLTGDASAVLVDCEFLGNTAGGGEGGGAIASSSWEGFSLAECTFAGNAALAGSPGGAIAVSYWDGNDIQLSDCLLVGNYSEGHGGALYLGGEPYASSRLLMAGSTIAGNRTLGAGGGIAWMPKTAISAGQLDSTIVWGNGAGTAGDQLYIGNPGIAVDVGCSVVDSTGVIGGTVVYDAGTRFLSPRFCAAPSCDEAPFTEFAGFTVEAGSPCLPANNDCGVRVGVLGQGCTLTAVPGEAVAAPLRLAQNHPNPFNAHTSLGFTLTQAGSVGMRIYDPAGRERAALLTGVWLGPGTHRLDWDGTDDQGQPLPSGAYLCRLDASGQTDARKLILIK